MKPILCAVVLLFSCCACMAQTQEIPEFYNKVMLMQSGGTLRKLENADLRQDIRSAIGVGATYIVIQGTTSNVNLLEGYPYSFIVKTEPGVDPEDAVELFKADKFKNIRQFKISQFVIGSSLNVTIPKIKYTLTKIEGTVYKITPNQKLAAGEYIFIVNRPSTDMYKGTGGGGNFKGSAFTIAQ